MLWEFLVVVITIISNTIQLPFESIYLQVDLFTVPFCGFKVFPDIINLFSVLIKQSLCISENFVDFMVHLTDFGDILVVISLYNSNNSLLLFIKSVSDLINIVVRLLNQLSIQLYI